MEGCRDGREGENIVIDERVREEGERKEIDKSGKEEREGE